MQQQYDRDQYDAACEAASEIPCQKSTAYHIDARNRWATRKQRSNYGSQDGSDSSDGGTKGSSPEPAATAPSGITEDPPPQASTSVNQAAPDDEAKPETAQPANVEAVQSDDHVPQAATPVVITFCAASVDGPPGNKDQKPQARALSPLGDIDIRRQAAFKRTASSSDATQRRAKDIAEQRKVLRDQALAAKRSLDAADIDILESDDEDTWINGEDQSCKQQAADNLADDIRQMAAARLAIVNPASPTRPCTTEGETTANEPQAVSHLGQGESSSGEISSSGNASPVTSEPIGGEPDPADHAAWERGAEAERAPGQQLFHEASTTSEQM